MECDFIEKVSVVTAAEMGRQAFYHCASLKSVTLPIDLQTIGEQAFAECESLETINIPTRVKSIGSQVFYNARNLRNVTMPDSVTEIADDVFNGTNLYGEGVTLMANGTITCSMGSDAYNYAVSKGIATHVVDSSELDVKKTSTSVALLSDYSYLFDVTNSYNMRGTLHVELYNAASNKIAEKTQDASGLEVEYRTEFSDAEMTNVSFAKIYITDASGNAVSTEDEILSVDGGEIPAIPEVESDIVINYADGVVSFTGSTPIKPGTILIHAVYSNDGKLEDVDTYPITSVSNTVTIDTDFIAGNSKLMLWNGFEQIKPLADDVII